MQTQLTPEAKKIIEEKFYSTAIYNPSSPLSGFENEKKAAARWALTNQNLLRAQGRFIKPTIDQVVRAAIVFNDGRMNNGELTNMVSLADFIIERLYENGDMSIPASNEEL